MSNLRATELQETFRDSPLELVNPLPYPMPRCPRRMPSQQEILHTFLYRDGNLWWWNLEPGNPTSVFGELAGIIDNRGYTRIQWLGKEWLAHRLIIKMFCGKDYPENAPFVDHIIGTKVEVIPGLIQKWDAPWNLRWISHSDNCKNIRSYQIQMAEDYFCKLST